MSTLNRLLDAAKAHTEARTVQSVADRLGVSRQTLYDWKSGEVAISDEHLARLVELANAAPDEAIAVRKETAKSDHERALWRSLARRLTAAAVIALCAVAVPVISGVSTAYAATTSEQCILCK